MSGTPVTDAQPHINRYPEYHAGATLYVSEDFAKQMEIELREAYKLLDKEFSPIYSHRARKWLGRNERFNPDNYAKPK